MSTTALLFMVLCFAGLAMAFVKHPMYGMYAYMLVFYMSPGEAWWSTEVPRLPWGELTAGGTLVAALIHRPRTVRPPWYQTAAAGWMVLFTVWLWIQTPWVLSLEDQLFLATLFSKYVLLYAVLYTCLTDQKSVGQFFLAHILGSFLWGLAAYQNPGSGRLEDLGFGDVAGSAFASMHMGTALAFAGFAFLGTSGFLRWASLASIPFVLNAIILMATRGAFVGLLGGAMAAWFAAPKARRRWTRMSIVLGAVLLAVLAHDLFWARMSTILPSGHERQLEESAESRIFIAQANLRMFADHPLGVGHRGNDILSPEYMDQELLTPKDGKLIRSAHNTIMAVLVDHGFFGLILFAFFHVSVVRSVLRARSHAPQDAEIGSYVAALGTALMIYWANAQFVNVTKAEVVIWIAALGSALKWMTDSANQGSTVASTQRRSLMRGDADSSGLRPFNGGRKSL